MLRDMPCRKGRVVHYNNEAASPILTQRLKEEKWFGFAEVDIEIPEHLHPMFEEMCPFFYNKEVPVEAVPQHMLDYLKSHFLRISRIERHSQKIEIFFYFAKTSLWVS